jgi:hypothetical protein
MSIELLWFICPVVFITLSIFFGYTICRDDDGEGTIVNVIITWFILGAVVGLAYAGIYAIWNSWPISGYLMAGIGLPLGVWGGLTIMIPAITNRMHSWLDGYEYRQSLRESPIELDFQIQSPRQVTVADLMEE